MMGPRLKYPRGTILIMALWVLGFLSVFAVTIGVHVRQKITLLSRLEKRSALQHLAEAGVRKAKAVFDSRHLGQGLPVSGSHKQAWFNDPVVFRAQRFGPGSFEVGYDVASLGQADDVRQYGLTDEERRVNLNKADRYTLKRLIALAGRIDEERADDLARAIISWREYGETDIVGFYSDAFYENLEFPYELKKKPFEHLEELRLVDGMSPDLFERLFDVVTVYGSGEVNINTTSELVLVALGLTQEAAQQILTIRRGPDGLDATADDYMFMVNQDTNSLTLPAKNALAKDQVGRLHELLKLERVGVSSSFFRIESEGRLSGRAETMTITCVFEGKSGRIFYWKEERRHPPAESALPWAGG